MEILNHIALFVKNYNFFGLNRLLFPQKATKKKHLKNAICQHISNDHVHS